MSITLSALQKQRRDSAANWTAENPTLLAGEIGIESDTGYWKVGNGSSAWNSLAYVPGLGAEFPVSRLADGSARQLLQTAANGTDVEWTSNVDVPGTLDVTGAATFDNNVTVQGDLTVNGTEVIINTQTLEVEDKNVIIGKVATPTDVTADGGGITLKGTTDKTINWVDATDAWTLSEHVNIASGKEYRINGTKVLNATSLGSSVLITSANITDGTIVNADINASAAIAGTKISPDFGSQTVQTTGIISHALGTAAAPTVTFTGDTNTGIYSPGADQLALATNGTGRLFVDSSGNVGVRTASPNVVLEVNGATRFTRSSTPTQYVEFTGSVAGSFITGVSAVGNAKELILAAGANSDMLRLKTIAAMPIVMMTSDTERLRITSDGRLLLGTSTSIAAQYTGEGKLQIAGTDIYNLSALQYSNNVFESLFVLGKSRGSTTGTHVIVQNNDALGGISFEGSDGTGFIRAAQITAFVDGTPGTNDMPGRLVFSTTADGASSLTERMRIGQGGVIWMNPEGTGLVLGSGAAAGTTQALIIGRYSRTTHDTGTTSFNVFTNGNVTNTNNSYGAISDIKLKENIVDANSQWDDLKALQVRNYNFKEGQTHTQIGLVAQEVELVSPGLVTESPDRDEEGNDLGTVTKSVNYSVLYMKAVKALQEAMERIETLEAKVAALEAS